METENTKENEFYSEDQREYDEYNQRKKQVFKTERDKGFILNEDGTVNTITKLWPSVQFFKQKFYEEHFDSETIRNFELIGNIKGDYVQDYSRSFKDENEKMGSPEIEYRKDVVKFNVCWIVKVTFMSVFNTPDEKIYYIVFRHKFFNRWDNTYYENAKKYFDRDGITLKTDILEHAMNQNKVEISTLVLVTGNTKIYYTPMKEVLDLAQRKIGIFTDKWNQVCVGIPKEIMLEEDVNKYN